MKTTVFAAATLLSLAAAQPHGGKSSIRVGSTSNIRLMRISGAHHVHEKRYGAPIVTSTEVVTASQPAAVVVVDQNGKVISTSVVGQGGPTDHPKAEAYEAAPAAPAYHPAAAPAPAHPAPAPQHHEQHAPAPAPAPQHHEKAPAPAPAPAPEHHDHEQAHKQKAQAPHSYPAPKPVTPAPEHPSSGGGSSGIAYSPYNADQSCKSSDQVKSDLAKISGYDMIRIYGTDCNQVSNVLPVAKAKGMKVFAGIFDINNVGNECGQLIEAVHGDWGMIDTVSIGNELVNSQGAGMIPKVISGIGIAKALLKGAGYHGPVVSVDTFNTLEQHPEICHASDYAAANAHAFFDSTVTADKAGQWAQGTAKRVEAACGKKVVITESGWPHSGNANGLAVPSPENQKKAVASLQSAFPHGGLIMYSAFNDLWKQDNGNGDAFGCEKNYGIFG